MKELSTGDLLTPEQAMKLLGLSSKRTLRTLRETRQLGYVVVARKARFQPEHIEEYIRRSEVKAILRRSNRMRNRQLGRFPTLPTNT